MIPGWLVVLAMVSVTSNVLVASDWFLSASMRAELCADARREQWMRVIRSEQMARYRVLGRAEAYRIAAVEHDAAAAAFFGHVEAFSGAGRPSTRPDSPALPSASGGLLADDQKAPFGRDPRRELPR